MQTLLHLMGLNTKSCLRSVPLNEMLQVYNFTSYSNVLYARTFLNSVSKEGNSNLKISNLKTGEKRRIAVTLDTMREGKIFADYTATIIQSLIIAKLEAFKFVISR